MANSLLYIAELAHCYKADIPQFKGKSTGNKMGSGMEGKGRNRWDLKSEISKEAFFKRFILYLDIIFFF